MKKLIMFIVALGLFVFTPTAIIAQNDEGDDGGVRELTIIDDSKQSEKYRERLQQLRNKIEERISEAKERSLENKCELVAEKVSGAIAAGNQYHQQRATIYSSWRDRLGTLSARLQASGVDTTNLEALLEELDTQIATTSSNVQTYLADLEDMTTQSCLDDAGAFYEAIQNVRAARQLIIEDHRESVKLIKEDIKTELNNLKNSLDVKKDSEGVE